MLNRCRQPLTEWPADDAPIAEWARPLSATMRNTRQVASSSVEDPNSRTLGGGKHIHTKARSLRFYNRIRELVRQGCTNREIANDIDQPVGHVRPIANQLRRMEP